MKKLALLIIFSSLLLAKTYEGTYKISYGIFGELGVAKSTLTINEDYYEIEIKASATGIARFLSNGKEETYKSYGVIKNNTFYSNKYITDKKTNNKQKIKSYIFDYENEIIKVFTTSKYEKVTFDQNYETTKEWISEDSQSQNSFFTNSDILSLFFNVSTKLKSFDKSANYEFTTLGAKEESGKINVYFPSLDKKKYLDEIFENEDEKMIVNINQPIFSSQKGELFISVNKEGFSNKAILKDVILFGDITGELIDFKIKD